MRCLKVLPFCLFVFLAFLPYKVKGSELKVRPSPFLKKLLDKHGFENSHISYSLIPLNKDETKTSYRETLPMIPASVTKVPTAWAALETLGENKTFSTQLWSSTQKVSDGVLQGDLYLVGGGDPFLTYSDLIDLILHLKMKGIKKIKGSFHYDQNLFPVNEKISEIGEGDQTYNPAVAPLNLEFNQFTAYQQSEEEWLSIPPFNVFEFKTTDDDFSPSRSFKYLKRYSEQNGKEAWLFSTQNHYRTKEDLPVRNPGKVTASAFRWMASLWDIEIPSAKMKKANKESLNLLATKSSKPLKDLVASTLEYSNNLFAESLLLHFALGKGQKSPTIKSAAEKLLATLKDNFDEELFKDWILVNGSGLTTKNRMTSHSLTSFLKSIHDDSFGETTFPGLLTLSGNNGSMKRRLGKPKEALRVWAKTGSLDYVNNLTGYLFAESGEAYAFSIFVNDKEKRRIVSGADTPRARRLKREAGHWHGKARDLIDDILRHWLAHF